MKSEIIWTYLYTLYLKIWISEFFERSEFANCFLNQSETSSPPQNWSIWSGITDLKCIILLHLLTILGILRAFDCILLAFLSIIGFIIWNNRNSFLQCTNSRYCITTISCSCYSAARDLDIFRLSFRSNFFLLSFFFSLSCVYLLVHLFTFEYLSYNKAVCIFHVDFTLFYFSFCCYHTQVRHNFLAVELVCNCRFASYVSASIGLALL